jgi:hypothetical protein
MEFDVMDKLLNKIPDERKRDLKTQHKKEEGVEMAPT